MSEELLEEVDAALDEILAAFRTGHDDGDAACLAPAQVVELARPQPRAA